MPLTNVEGLYRYLGIVASLVERQARVTETNVPRQYSSSRGISFDDFKKLGSPYFSGTLDPTKAKAGILKMEKFFDTIDCFEDKKASYTSFMINNKINY